MSRPFKPHRGLAAALLILAGGAGCVPHAEREVIVYTALDEEFSRPIFEEFTRQTGVAVRAKFDVESTKSVQLTQAIFAERDRPRCDVFWNNEIVNTLRLGEAGLLAPYKSPEGAKYPAEYRSTDDTWYGFAARARILIVNTKLVPETERPGSIHDLVDPKWKDRCGIAKPLAGTTATHAAYLFAAWGDEPAQEFFRAVKGNCRVLGGNKQVARAVADGELAFGITDTDDAIVEVEAGMPVAIVWPDQAKAESGKRKAEAPEVSNTTPNRVVPDPGRPLGTLIIPNTLAIVKGAAHREAAEQLVEYLLSAKVEGRLVDGPSAQLPLNPETKATSRVARRWRDASGTPERIVTMKIDFAAAAKSWDAAARFLRDEFATAE